MTRQWFLAVSLVLGLCIGCGNQSGPPDAERDGGGGKSGLNPANPNAGPTPAERTGSAASNNAAPALSAEDQQFVQKAAMGGQMEVTLGNLAEDRASDQRVKELGQRIADDHERANRDLQSSVGGDAAQAGQHAPEHDAVRQKLEAAKGAAFDRDYVAQMVADHQKDIAAFERAAQSANAQVKSFAERTLPTLRQHLEMSRQLQQSVK